jgi:hypothetical protein
MKRLPTSAHYVLAVLLFAFAMMGATNAVHVEAKALYGVLNAVAGAWFIATRIRARHSS